LVSLIRVWGQSFEPVLILKRYINEIYSSFPGSDNVEYQFAMNSDTTEYLAKELLPHTVYTFFVVAYSPMGASPPSLPVTVEMLEDGEYLNHYTD